MPDLLAELADRVLVCDGAVGTMLHAEGHSLRVPLATFNVTNPSLVRAVHDGYVAAGVDIVQTNTFGASRHRLAAHGYGDRVREVNLAGIRLAREAAAATSRRVFVAGSVSPTVTVSQRNRVRPEQRIEALHEQIDALVEGGVDLLVLETFGSLVELTEAVEAAAGLAEVPIVAQATFAEDGRTFAGDTPEEVAKTLSSLPVAVIGANCTLGPSGLYAVLEAMAAAAALPLAAQPNAGLALPSGADGGARYELDEEYLCSYIRRYVQLGAAIVGGCCGTTPDHLRAVVRTMAPDATRAAPSRRPPSSPSPHATRAASLPARPHDLRERLAAGEPLVAVEVAPSLGGISEDEVRLVAELPARRVDQLFISAATSTRAQVSTLSYALHVQQHAAVRATLAATTWDRSIMTLQADMLGAFALGIGNVVCETGGPPVRGDYPSVDGVWEVDELTLLELLTRLNDGRDWDGLPLRAATSFTIGARCNPGATDLEAEAARTQARLDAGAQFLVTRPVYEARSLTRLLGALDAVVPVLAVVRPLANLAEAELLHHEVSDVSIPDETLEALRDAGELAADVGVTLAGELVGALAPMVAGVVVAAADRPPALLALVERARAALGLDR